MKSEQKNELMTRIASAAGSGWTAFEKQLIKVSAHPQFIEYLSTYRGIAEGREPDDKSVLLSDELTQSAIQLVQNTISGLQENYSADSENDFGDLLRFCEGTLNLGIYFWHFPEERNFQFRTVIHFLNISSEPLLISGRQSPDFFMRLTEWGIQISESDCFEPFPYRLSLERACSLHDLRWDDACDERAGALRLSALRVIQREFCQLIDEWEHCNSILAVRQFALRKLPASEQESARAIFAEIARARDLLAAWCTGSAADLQRHVSNGLCSSNLHPDVMSELAATSALLLSGFQKFFLPASVSRHIYGNEVILEFRRFNSERLRSEPEDMYSLIAGAAFDTALEADVDWTEIINFLDRKSFSWSLSADPFSAVKSVSWAFSAPEHYLLTVLPIIAVNAKREPNKLDSYWLQTFAAAIEIPSTFGRGKVLRNLAPLSSAQMSELRTRALACVSHFEHDAAEETQTAWNYVTEFLKSEITD